ncbi:hypothetical protein L7F22_057874 [Adiantum nelumboides]|nr:hypothetical protein [Adiantum nelumboides]
MTEKPTTWVDFCAKFKKDFAKMDPLKAYAKLQSLTMKALTFDKYTTAFKEALTFCKVDATHAVHMYMLGLHEDYRSALIKDKAPSDIEDAVSKARMFHLINGAAYEKKRATDHQSGEGTSKKRSRFQPRASTFKPRPSSDTTPRGGGKEKKKARNASIADAVKKGACFSCGQQGHQMKDCPSRKTKKPQGRPSVQIHEISGNSDFLSVQVHHLAHSPCTDCSFRTKVFDKHDLLRFPGKINGHDVTILLDNGSSHNFVDAKLVQMLHLPTRDSDHEYRVKMARGEDEDVWNQMVPDLQLEFADYKETLDFHIICLDRADVILGIPWFYDKQDTLYIDYVHHSLVFVKQDMPNVSLSLCNQLSVHKGFAIPIVTAIEMYKDVKSSDVDFYHCVRSSWIDPITFDRRGYAAERQEGLLFGAKVDYIQSLLLQKVFNWFAKPLFRSGTWINQLKRSKESDGSKNWAEEFTEWLKEPLKPEIEDDISGIIADSLTDKEKEDYLPFWIAAQKAVPRYETFLSSVGSRGMLLRKILVWMRILPPPSPKLSVNSGIGSTSFASSPRDRSSRRTIINFHKEIVRSPVHMFDFEDDLVGNLAAPNSDLDARMADIGSNEELADDHGGNNLARISMRDIWLPASKMVCGNNIWRRLQSAFLVFLSRSTLQEPAYKELVLLYNLPSAADDEKEDNIPNLQLKIYGKIPIPDLKVIFPNKKLSFRILDTVRLDVATMIGLLAFLINYRFDDFLSSPSAFVLDVIASSALIVYISRVALGYKQTYDRYQLLVNKTLYEKTLASGFGAAQFLVDASEQQQFKECVLAFALLMNEKNAQGETRESLAIKCENFLLSHFKEQVEMPVDEALANLSRLGLIEEKPSSCLDSTDNCYVLHARPYIQSLSVLRERWTDLLSDESLPITFLRSLYQTSQ